MTLCSLPQGVRTAVLRLQNLEVGDYTFSLKVTDTSGQTSTADVRVFVKPGTSGVRCGRGAKALRVLNDIPVRCPFVQELVCFSVVSQDRSLLRASRMSSQASLSGARLTRTATTGTMRALSF